MKKAVILLSGGLDSVTVLALALREGYECYALGFSYGQRHLHEVEKAKKIAAKYDVNYKAATIDLTTFGGSALTDKNINVPKHIPPFRGDENTDHIPPFRGDVRGVSAPNRRPYNSLNVSKARDLRNNPTNVEKILWDKLKSKQLGYKFRRQEPLGNYIVDFVCLEKKIIIELDGGQHALAENYDTQRDQYFQTQGYEVLRFWNNEVIENLESALHVVSAKLGTTPTPPERRGNKSEIPITYVPARNTIFLSYALAYAEVLGANDIFIGVNALDFSGYPDCRPEYIAAFEKMANLATKSGNFRIRAPLINLTKTQIIQLGTENNVDYSMTTSCYDPVGDQACGACDACILRLKGFEEAGIKDPVRYV